MTAMTMKEYIAMLERATKQVRTAITRDLTEIGLRQRNLAQGYIGQELPEWPPLADSTIEEKERLGYTGVVSDTDPLLRTGEMRDSIEAVVTPTATGVKLDVGSNDPVALYQEMGTPTIPPRPFIALSAIAVMDFAKSALGKSAVAIFTEKIEE